MNPQHNNINVNYQRKNYMPLTRMQYFKNVEASYKNVSNFNKAIQKLQIKRFSLFGKLFNFIQRDKERSFSNERRGL